MFGRFARGTPPLDAEAKRWVEWRLHWLAEQFGLDCFVRDKVILPTPEFFPDTYDLGEDSVRRMLHRVCNYMGVDRRLVNLELFSNPNPLWLVDDAGHYLPTAAGTFEARQGYCIISLEASQIEDPQSLVGTMAHELAHFLLVGEHRLDGDELDEELLTDLTAVYHGFGLFLGNSPRNWDSLYGVWPGTELRKPEYMTLPMYGYALAHAAWWRGERRPAWIAHMNSDLKSCFKPSVRFLFESGDSTFCPS